MKEARAKEAILTQAPQAADNCNEARPSGSVPKEPRRQFHQGWGGFGGETLRSLVILALGSLVRQIAQCQLNETADSCERLGRLFQGASVMLRHSPHL